MSQVDITIVAVMFLWHLLALIRPRETKRTLTGIVVDAEESEGSLVAGC